MKILFISDTHKLHRKLKNLPDADLLIHGGDIEEIKPESLRDKMGDIVRSLHITYDNLTSANN